MQTQRPSSMSTFAMLASLGVSSLLILADSQQPVSLAQPSSNSTSVRINNLTRMAPINQALKQQYETQFPDSTIQIQTQQPDSPLELKSDNANLAAISRLLTTEEKASGLVQVPITREKIAIVVGQDNPYATGLTIDQVVKIFRGEITDWSQLGGKPGPIRVIHRPIASNLQSTLQTYALFQNTDFKAGGKITQLDQDSITTLSNELGQDGISYALASQIQNAQAIRPVSMYNTLPDDPRYPFSQPFTYIYKGTPTASTKTFLDYVASEQGQAAIAEAKEKPTQFTSDLTSDSAVSPDNSSSSPNPSASSNGSEDNAQSANPQSESSGSSEPNGSESTSVASNPTETTGDTSGDSSGLGWLPIGLMVLVAGGIIGGVVKTVLAKSKPKKAPRPAPNYAEKIRPTRIQGGNTEIQPPPEGSSNNLSSTASNSASSATTQAGVTTGAAAMGIAAESLPSQTSSEDASPPSEWVDITSKELQAQTRIQESKTELQDTPPAMRGPKTQLQDPATTQLQTFDEHDSGQADLSASPDHGGPEIEVFEDAPNITSLQEPNPTQLQDPNSTFLQEPSPALTQDLQTTQLQDSSQTQLQDPTVTSLQEPSPTQLQDPKQTWSQEEGFSDVMHSSETQLQDPSSTQLQDPSATFLQEPSATQLQEVQTTQLQDAGQTQLQDPKQTWSQEEDFSDVMHSSETQLQDPSSTQLQDPSQTNLQDPKQTWIQNEEFPEGMDPSVTPLPDPKQTWSQDNSD